MNTYDLVKMNLHEGIGFDNYEVVRVVGGWMYTQVAESGMGGFNLSSCFVPEPPTTTKQEDV